MAHNHNRERMLTPPDTRSLQNQPTSTETASEEANADVDEPPDNQNTPRPTSNLIKPLPAMRPRKLSALTKMLNSSEENESLDEEDDLASPSSRRGFSTTSTWSNPSIASTAELTSDGLTSPDTRTNTPSPPPPSTVTFPAVVFNHKSFQTRPVIIKDHSDSIDPLQKSATPDATAKAFETEFKRKRCIAFACGRKEAPKTEPQSEQKPEVKAEETPKRKCMLTFVCPSKASKEEPSVVRKPSVGRRPSPAPRNLKTPPTTSPHRRRSSVSSVQSAIQKPLRQASSASRLRRLSTAGEGDTLATERIAEYSGMRTEDDDWMKERTCHRSRLTVNDTLKIELGLQKLGKEAEEEEEIEVEEDMDNEGLEIDDVDEDEDVADEEEDGTAELTATGDDDESDDGFYSDDEGGMVDSDDDSDADSDYHWWAPGRSTAATSFEQLDHMHFTRQRNMSGSSIGSISSTKAISGDGPEPLSDKKLRKQRSIPIRPREADLPDSTDFVCGTLDEDRPMEESYRREIEKRRAAKHRVCPQDIDPTFPTSDPEMDEEDDEDVFDNHHEDESDVHEGVFGAFEPDDIKPHDLRGRPRHGRSPVPSPPKRLQSPPPRRPTVHRSPPPRRLFGQSPKRLRSPPPAHRLRSPPPTRRTSFAKSPKNHIAFQHIALAERPHGQQLYSSSLPRKPNLLQPRRAPSPIPDIENDSGDDDVVRVNLLTRGAIDIVKGLEKKRQFRKEKLYQKYCRQRANGSVKPKEEKRCVPGKGAERMREMGLELAGRWKGEKKYQYDGMTSTNDAQHILSL
ncbi:hypothetical protein NA57DRAFT_80789 [Rhizodiscina lignyota]|uniref:Extensin domain-containing protein n=1 Tax=Rhizodiscina lignyota TaxID=1504668 RepID=A0A9P4I6E3_9PEZI|nr:hypothetical protein NA57DRAFT_80789 [Rhizodiscina lignyota]